MSKTLVHILVVLASLSITGWAAAANKPEVVDLRPDKNVDVYFQINLEGKVYVNLRAPDGGEACAEFWWINWPFGNISSLGRHCGSAEFDIPGLFGEGSIASKLRAGGATNRVRIAATDDVDVAHNLVSVEF